MRALLQADTTVRIYNAAGYLNPGCDNCEGITGHDPSQPLHGNHRPHGRLIPAYGLASFL